MLSEFVPAPESFDEDTGSVVAIPGFGNHIEGFQQRRDALLILRSGTCRPISLVRLTNSHTSARTDSWQPPLRPWRHFHFPLGTRTTLSVFMSTASRYKDHTCPGTYDCQLARHGSLAQNAPGVFQLGMHKCRANRGC